MDPPCAVARLAAAGQPAGGLSPPCPCSAAAEPCIPASRRDQARPRPAAVGRPLSAATASTPLVLSEQRRCSTLRAPSIPCSAQPSPGATYPIGELLPARSRPTVSAPMIHFFRHTVEKREERTVSRGACTRKNRPVACMSYSSVASAPHVFGTTHGARSAHGPTHMHACMQPGARVGFSRSHSHRTSIRPG